MGNERRRFVEDLTGFIWVYSVPPPPLKAIVGKPTIRMAMLSTSHLSFVVGRCISTVVRWFLDGSYGCDLPHNSAKLGFAMCRKRRFKSATSGKSFSKCCRSAVICNQAMPYVNENALKIILWYRNCSARGTAWSHCVGKVERRIGVEHLLYTDPGDSGELPADCDS